MKTLSERLDRIDFKCEEAKKKELRIQRVLDCLKGIEMIDWDCVYTDCQLSWPRISAAININITGQELVDVELTICSAVCEAFGAVWSRRATAGQIRLSTAITDLKVEINVRVAVGDSATCQIIRTVVGTTKSEPIFEYKIDCGEEEDDDDVNTNGSTF